MTANSTLLESVDVDIFPTRELDEILDVLFDSSAFRDEESLDARGELIVESVDVEHQSTDGPQRRSSFHRLQRRK